MTGLVPHYLCGQWRTPKDTGTPRRHAVSGAEVYRVTAVGVDAGPAVAHARTVGIPALHGLGFAGRARVAKLLARHLARYQAEFVALAGHLGSSPADTEHDVRAGLDALRGHADAVTRHLAGETTNDGSLLVEPVTHVSPAAHLSVAHLSAAPPGIAVHISGFADPVTTMLDGFAGAFVLGVPSIVRPSRRTAELTAHLVRRISECDAVPPGCLQLVTGPTDLTGCLGPHDQIRFNGTAATAGRLRILLARQPMPPRAEFTAGILDCAVLGTDAADHGRALHLFVERLVAGMSAHNGQTRQAVRRAFVPETLMDAVGQAASSTLGGLRRPATVLGPLVDAAHRRRVLSALARLRRATRTVCGTSKEMAFVATEFGSGAYLPPVVLAADDAHVHDLHRVEAFGPVVTLIPYRDADEIARAVTLGAGGLRSWIITADPGQARDLVRALAPTHDRVHLIDPETSPATDAALAPGKGQHPGRLRTRLTATTVGGTPAHLTAATDRWAPGSPPNTSDTNALRLHLSDLRLGDTVTAGPRVVTRADIAAFAELTGDHYYLHTDEAAAASHPLFHGIIAHGHLVAALAIGMLVPPEPGPVLANLGLDNLRFLAPVRPGNPLTVAMTATRITPRPGTGRGEVRWHAIVAGAGGRPVARFDLTTLTADRPTTDRPTTD